MAARFAYGLNNAQNVPKISFVSFAPFAANIPEHGYSLTKSNR